MVISHSHYKTYNSVLRIDRRLTSEYGGGEGKSPVASAPEAGRGGLVVEYDVSKVG